MASAHTLTGTHELHLEQPLLAQRRALETVKAILQQTITDLQKNVADLVQRREAGASLFRRHEQYPQWNLALEETLRTLQQLSALPGLLSGNGEIAVTIARTRKAARLLEQGSSLLDTADGALGELCALLQKLFEQIKSTRENIDRLNEHIREASPRDSLAETSSRADARAKRLQEFLGRDKEARLKLDKRECDMEAVLNQDPREMPVGVLTFTETLQAAKDILVSANVVEITPEEVADVRASYPAPAPQPPAPPVQKAPEEPPKPKTVAQYMQELERIIGDMYKDQWAIYIDAWDATVKEIEATKVEPGEELNVLRAVLYKHYRGQVPAFSWWKLMTSGWSLLSALPADGSLKVDCVYSLIEKMKDRRQEIQAEIGKLFEQTVRPQTMITNPRQTIPTLGKMRFSMRQLNHRKKQLGQLMFENQRCKDIQDILCFDVIALLIKHPITSIRCAAAAADRKKPRPQ